MMWAYIAPQPLHRVLELVWSLYGLSETDGWVCAASTLLLLVYRTLVVKEIYHLGLLPLLPVVINFGL